MTARSDWRVLLCDKNGVPLSNISALCHDKQITEALSQPTSFSFSLDPNDNRVLALHTDGAPMLEYIRRCVKVYRRELQPDSSWKYINRFTGWVWPIQDEGDAESQVSRVTCYDPLVIMGKRFVRDAAGSFTLVTFDAVDAAQALKQAVDRTNSFAGPSGLTTAGGLFPVTENIKVRYQYKKVAEMMSEVTTRYDIACLPLDTQTGDLGQLNVYTKRGSQRPDVLLSWKYAPHNIETVSRTMDPTDAATTLVGLGNTVGGQQLIAVATDSTAAGAYMTLEEIVNLGDVTDQTYLDNLAASELFDRRPPQWAVSCKPTSDVTPWVDFNTGDTCFATAAAELRGGFIKREVRIYGFTLSISDEGDEDLDIVTNQDTT